MHFFISLLVIFAFQLVRDHGELTARMSMENEDVSTVFVLFSSVSYLTGRPLIEEESDSEQHEFEGKSTFSIFFIGLSPISPEEWKEQNILMKILTIFQVSYFLIKLH